MAKKNIPINKGHFELDTKERIKSFQCKLSTCWEKQYEEYRKLWEELPQKQQVREYPLLLDLEMSSICNLKCPMCPTISKEYKSKVDIGLLDFEIVKKAIDEIAGKVFALRLSLVGESTLHKKLVNAIKYAKEKGINEVSFLTNGSKLDLDYFKDIANAGIDWITISIDGVDNEYEKIRKPLKFKDTLGKLIAIKNYKMANNLQKPVIKVQAVWPSIKKNPTLFYNTIAPLVDLVAFNPLIDYLHFDSEIVYEKNFICSQLYQRMVICSNGMIKLCTNDEWRQVIIGNAKDSSIYEVWHGEKINRIREQHSKNDGFKELAVCKKCYFPRKTKVDEIAFVNDREILIENYINRNQIIGQ